MTVHGTSELICCPASPYFQQILMCNRICNFYFFTLFKVLRKHIIKYRHQKNLKSFKGFITGHFIELPMKSNFFPDRADL